MLHIVAPNAGPWGLSIRNNTYWSTDDSKAFKIYQDNSGVTHFYNAGNADVMTFTVADNATVPGCITANAGTLGTCLSDARLKKDIIPVTGAWKALKPN